MSEVFRVLRIGDVDDGGTVRLVAAGQRVHRAAAVVTDVRNPAIALPLDLRLIRAAALQIAVADERHVAGVGALAAVALTLCRRADPERETQRHQYQSPSRRHKYSSAGPRLDGRPLAAEPALRSARSACRQMLLEERHRFG